jgi:hypothetical protein
MHVLHAQEERQEVAMILHVFLARLDPSPVLQEETPTVQLALRELIPLWVLLRVHLVALARILSTELPFAFK